MPSKIGLAHAQFVAPEPHAHPGEDVCWVWPSSLPPVSALFARSRRHSMVLGAVSTLPGWCPPCYAPGMLTRREHEDALEALLRAALAGESLTKTMREFRGLALEDLASRTGMPVARFMGEERQAACLHR